MGDRAVFVIAGPGGPTRHHSSFGAIGLDLDLPAGPDAALPFLRDHAPQDGWYDDDTVEADVLADRWSGWTVEFWEDRWSEHRAACGGRFGPPEPDRAAALAEVRDLALERWAGPRRDARAALVARLPHVPVGRGFAPAVRVAPAAAARAAIETAYREAAGP